MEFGWAPTAHVDCFDRARWSEGRSTEGCPVRFSFSGLYVLGQMRTMSTTRGWIIFRVEPFGSRTIVSVWTRPLQIRLLSDYCFRCRIAISHFARHCQRHIVPSKKVLVFSVNQRPWKTKALIAVNYSTDSYIFTLRSLEHRARLIDRLATARVENYLYAALWRTHGSRRMSLPQGHKWLSSV